MDSVLLQLHRNLKLEPTLENRQRYTSAALRSGTGVFAVWRSGVGAPPEAEFIEVEQPLSLVPSDAPSDQLTIKQQFQCLALTDLSDLLQLLPVHPTGLFDLSNNKYHPFRDSNLTEIINRQQKTKFQTSECIYQPLYDTCTVARNGTSQLTFFQIPLGGTPVGSVRYKDQTATNMDQGGSLPYPKNFVITGFSIIVDPTLAYDEAVRFLDAGWFRLFIGTMDYLVLPLDMTAVIPGRKNPVVSLRHPDPMGPVLSLPEEIELIPQQNFRVELNFPYPQEYSRSFEVKAVLHGFFKRRVH